ncbi:alanine--tRNA ligase-related protein [Tepidiforma flava]|uniref:alanine--tRNA ligase n=1 Tax=Tepidiforma flava TaxID=3004094 RepID=A0ABY7MB91_9CHLR|nr:alanine--tRNA ligase-related protein [Tepidiforma flava]WBL37502.1 alanine--tRNA ligase-related protein [Tepidiforma flava]
MGDPTSMFTSAGMQQFKPQFMGEEPPAAPRVVTVQRCFRTTDIEEVGDLSHLTAFEMLGNFSFGDYFKREAIRWAWELLTGVYRLDPARLHATIYLDDDDSYGYWREVGLPDDHIHRRDEDLNYWFSFPKDTPGASGPCGPDSEIYYDLDPSRDPAEARLHTGPDGRPAGVGYSDRFLEIWNLVFMQLYQHPDGRRTNLPAQNIDTGSGLERVAMVLQGKRSVFETDIFLPILAEAQAVVGVDYLGGAASELQAYAIRAMAEHCRAATLLIGDGVVPSNEGRGYVLRRVIRRAIYFARKVGVREPFTHRLAEAAIGRLGGAYPHLVENRQFIQRALSAEEERFTRTLEAGTHRLEDLLERLRAAGAAVIPGDEAFTLYDTFGLPVELTREIAAAEGFTVDDAGFQAALEAQRQRARQQGAFLKGEVSPSSSSSATTTPASSATPIPKPMPPSSPSSAAAPSPTSSLKGRRASSSSPPPPSTPKAAASSATAGTSSRRPASSSSRTPRPPAAPSSTAAASAKERSVPASALPPRSTSTGAAARPATTPAPTSSTPPSAPSSAPTSASRARSSPRTAPVRLHPPRTDASRSPPRSPAARQRKSPPRPRSPVAHHRLPPGHRSRRPRLLRRQVRQRSPRRRNPR